MPKLSRIGGRECIAALQAYVLHSYASKGKPPVPIILKGVSLFHAVRLH